MVTNRFNDRMKIKSRSPTRIDLAGGTLDLWPLYLFLKNPLTINIAIDLFAEVTLIEEPGNGKIVFRSEDQNIESSLSWDRLCLNSTHPALELHTRLLRHFQEEKIKSGNFKPEVNFSLITRAKSPSGAGLGGSSSLNIALTGALATWARGSIDPEKDGAGLIRIARDIETQVIQVPAGLQDYYGALFGGLQSLHWGAGSHAHEKLPASRMAELEKRILLFYSGQSRNSGINNWALYKNFIDGVGQARQSFEEITLATHLLHSALKSGDWQEVRTAIDSEWAVRKTLAPGICTDQMDTAFTIAKEEAPQVTGKVCGAGGGGCFFLFLPDPDEDLCKRLQTKLLEIGIQPLPFGAVSQGLKIQSGAE